MEYIILHHTRRLILEQFVNDYIKDGWQPKGGVSFDSSNGKGYIQAMIKIK